jgi:hypothetical protein
VRFCSNCGARLDGGAWCGNCGVRVSDPAPANTPPTPPPSPPDWAAPFHVPGDMGRPPLSPPTPDEPLANPFRGVPASDYVKDGAGIALLLGSLFLPWDNSGRLAEYWWALGSVLVLFLAVPLPYVMASGVFRRMTQAHSLWIKNLLALPLLVSAALALFGDLATIGEGLRDAPWPADEGGVGVAVAAALAGAALVVQPRAVEECGTPAMPGLWRHAGMATALGALVISAIGSAVYAASFYADGWGFSLGLLSLFLWAVATPVVGLGIPLYLTTKGDAGGRRALAVEGWTVLAVMVFWSLRDHPQAVESWRSFTAGTFALSLAAALLISRAAARRTDPNGIGPASWVRTARAALVTSAAIHGVAALAHGAMMMHLQSYTTALSISAVVALGGCVVSGVAGLMLVQIEQRAAVSVSAAFVVALGVAATVLETRNPTGPIELPALGYAAFFMLPFTALAALWIPGVVRSPASLPEDHHEDHRVFPSSV